MADWTRRHLLKYAAVQSVAAGGLGSSGIPVFADESAADPATVPVRQIRWANTYDRVFLGREVWANPMEDWCVRDGAALCTSNRGGRNVHALTRQVTDATGDLFLAVSLRRDEAGRDDVGFRIGNRSDVGDHKSSCFVTDGIVAGIRGGRLTVGADGSPIDIDWNDSVVLILSGRPTSDGRYGLKLRAMGRDGEIGSAETEVAAESILGNVAIANSLSNARGKRGFSRFAFEDWTFGGAAIGEFPEQSFGTLLWSMYTIDAPGGGKRRTLKLMALAAPLGKNDRRDVQFEIKRDGLWQIVATEDLQTDSWTAVFRIDDWDASVATPFRLTHHETGRDGRVRPSTWSGTIAAEPVGRPLRIAAMTCQNDYAFPYAPVADNLKELDPDLIYFSGDQLYENHGGFGVVRAPADRAIINYLRKYYQHGWAFGDIMRDRPALCIPDDHDVFQGNYWGEGGAAMPPEAEGTSSFGGYRQPPAMVNVVHRTNAGHHPDPEDATAVKQGISVYYGTLTYGEVGMAIISDRQFKSAPQRVDTGSGRADHVEDHDFDTAALDVPGLVLLGERQEDFLRRWVEDWGGHRMKLLLSQTVFAGMATHHGTYDGYLKADLDSGGWPQTARDQTIEILRRGKVLHVNGDQHLPSLVQYGVDEQRDSGWSFCTPAIAVGYPRWWRPDELGMPHLNRPGHGRGDTGEYLDGLGNRVYVYAVGDPEVGTKSNRYELAEQKGSGFGLVTVDCAARTYRIDAFRFLVDATEESGNQHPGWPVTIHQDENAGVNRLS